MARFTAQSDTLYLTDNGAAYCGDHLGNCAKTTGRDLSGQKIMAITPEIAADPDAAWIKCERCGKTPSRLHLATA